MEVKVGGKGLGKREGDEGKGMTKEDKRQDGQKRSETDAYLRPPPTPPSPAARTRA